MAAAVSAAATGFIRSGLAGSARSPNPATSGLPSVHPRRNGLCLRQFSPRAGPAPTVGTMAPGENLGTAALRRQELGLASLATGTAVVGWGLWHLGTGSGLAGVKGDGCDFGTGGGVRSPRLSLGLWWGLLRSDVERSGVGQHSHHRHYL